MQKHINTSTTFKLYAFAYNFQISYICYMQ